MELDASPLSVQEGLLGEMTYLGFIPSLSSKGVTRGYQKHSLEKEPILNKRSDPHSE